VNTRATDREKVNRISRCSPNAGTARVAATLSKHFISEEFVTERSRIFQQILGKEQEMTAFGIMPSEP
jgi:hypothetical protein